MNKFGQAVQAAELLISLLQEAQLEAQAAKEDAEAAPDPQIMYQRALHEARGELDKTAGALVTMRNQWLAEVKRREIAETTVSELHARLKDSENYPR